jgi:hypothetical protein
MKIIFRKLAAIWFVFLSIFISHQAKAASAKDINSRVNTVRKNLQSKIKKDNQASLQGAERYDQDQLSEWINWGNWGNWNNWNNWRNWNNWGNWGNWKNY